MAIDQIIDLANKIGAVGAVFAIGLHFEWWILGKTHRKEVSYLTKECEKIEQEKARYLNLVFEMKGMTQHSIDLVKQVKDAV